MPFERRSRFEWRLRTRVLALGERTLVMGIVNVTPDSFSDGGHFYSPQHAPEKAIAHALELLDAGADVVDVGGESTRPGAHPLTADEEQARVLPVIAGILKARPEALVSVDTFHASTARRAVDAGAEIVNDVSGHTWDAAMSMTCAETACGAVLMHARGTPGEWAHLPALPHGEVTAMVVEGLGRRVEEALGAGVERERIVVDPGFGFGKRMEENYPLLRRMDALRGLGLPVMVGISRKGFLGRTLEARVANPSSRLHATTAANVAAVLNGAHIVRVHDAGAAAEAVAIADAVLNAE